MPGPYPIVPPTDSDYQILDSVLEAAKTLYVLVASPRPPGTLSRAIVGIYSSQSHAMTIARTTAVTFNFPGSYRLYMISEAGIRYVNGNGTIPGS